MLTALKQIFVEHYVVLALLSISWLPVYFGFRGLDFFSRKVFVGFPMYLFIWRGRRRLGLPKWRSEILRLNEPFGEADALAAEVLKLSNEVHDKVARIRTKDHWATKLVRQESIEEELQTGIKDCWAMLESDHALTRAVSKDERTSASGLLSFIGNPHNPKPDNRNLLLGVLKYGEHDARRLALFHVKTLIDDVGQVRELESAVSGWSDPERLSAQRLADSLRKQFTPNASNVG